MYIYMYVGDRVATCFIEISRIEIPGNVVASTQHATASQFSSAY